jgi:outer membrane protein TolC
VTSSLHRPATHVSPPRSLGSTKHFETANLFRGLAASSLVLLVSLGSSGEALADPAAPAAEGDTPAPPMARSVSLRDAVTRAIARHPSVAVANADIARSDALVHQARAASYPTLIGNVVATRLDDDRTSAGRVLLAKEQLGANATLTVPIFAPSRWKTWSRAEDAVLSAQASAEEVKQRVAIAAARAYLAVVAQKRTREVRVLAKETADKHLSFAKQRDAGGVGNKLEVARVEQEVAITEAQIAQAEIGIVRSREALGVLLGEETPVDVGALDLPADIPPVPAAVEEVAQKRADLRAYQTRVQIAERAKTQDWAEYAPTLVGVAQPFYQNPPTFTQPRLGWQAQLVLTIPFYDGGNRGGIHAERDAIADSAHASYDGAVRQARSDVRAAGASVTQADAALTQANRSATLAKTALGLVTSGFEGGTLTALDVIDAEKRARDADLEVVLAEDAARQARVDLLVASGRLP